MALATISEIKARIAAIAALVSGVVSTYANAPRSLAPGDLPAVIVFASGATFNTQYNPAPTLAPSNDLAIQSRQYTVRVYVTPSAAGIDAEAESRVLPFLDTVLQEFLNRPRLGLDTAAALRGIIDSYPESDSGIVEYEIAGEKILGFEVRLRVNTLKGISYATNN